MVAMANPKPATTGTTAGADSPSQVAEPEIEYISTRKLKVPFDKAWLADESDVDEYLQQLRKALLREIKAGKRIQV